jgi:hypothetical protein
MGRFVGRYFFSKPETTPRMNSFRQCKIAIDGTRMRSNRKQTTHESALLGRNFLLTLYLSATTDWRDMDCQTHDFPVSKDPVDQARAAEASLYVCSHHPRVDSWLERPTGRPFIFYFLFLF